MKRLQFKAPTSDYYRFAFFQLITHILLLFYFSCIARWREKFNFAVCFCTYVMTQSKQVQVF